MSSSDGCVSAVLSLADYSPHRFNSSALECDEMRCSSILTRIPFLHRNDCSHNSNRNQKSSIPQNHITVKRYCPESAHHNKALPRVLCRPCQQSQQLIRSLYKRITLTKSPRNLRWSRNQQRTPCRNLVTRPTSSRGSWMRRERSYNGIPTCRVVSLRRVIGRRTVEVGEGG